MKYSLHVFPPDYFKYIWIVIYVTMGGIIIFNLIRNIWSLCAHVFLGINVISLAAKFILFDMGTDTLVFITPFILLGTIITGLIFWSQMGKVC